MICNLGDPMSLRHPVGMHISHEMSRAQIISRMKSFMEISSFICTQHGQQQLQYVIAYGISQVCFTWNE